MEKVTKDATRRPRAEIGTGNWQVHKTQHLLCLRQGRISRMTSVGEYWGFQIKPRLIKQRKMMWCAKDAQNVKDTNMRVVNRGGRCIPSPSIKFNLTRQLKRWNKIYPNAQLQCEVNVGSCANKLNENKKRRLLS